MCMPVAGPTTTAVPRGRGGPTITLIAAALGFFTTTLDTTIVNVALPTIGRDLGGGVSALQRVVDGYTLAFAALLLSTGALSVRFGASRCFAAGVTTFTAASAACGLASRTGTARASLGTDCPQGTTACRRGFTGRPRDRQEGCGCQ